MSIFSRTLVHLSRRFASTSSVPPKTSLSSSEYFHSHLSPPPWLSNCLLSLANPSTSVPSFNIPGGTELIRIDSSELTPPTHLKFPLPPQLATKNGSADQNKPQSMLINRKHYFTSILPTLLSESLSLDTPDPLYISLVQSLSQGFSDQPILQSYASSLITKHPTHLPSPLLTSLMYYYSSNSSSSLQSIALHSNTHPEFTPSLALQSWLLKVTGHDRETYLTPLNEVLRTNVNCVFTLNLLIGSDKLWNHVLKDAINRALKVQNGQNRQDPYLPRLMLLHESLLNVSSNLAIPESKIHEFKHILKSIPNEFPSSSTFRAVSPRPTIHSLLANMSSYILFNLSSPNTVIDLFQEFDLKRDGFRVGLNLGWALIVTGEEQAGREVVQFLKENDVNGIWQGAIDTWERRVQEYMESKEVSQ